jgi:tRNA1Val (adenine37-N6)-methyltransferase
MSFFFKQFSVNDADCSMKVGTDSVLLGAWADAPATGSVLDVGTGSGLLALMIAQRSKASITAIDVDQPSIKQAHTNFKKSDWGSRIEASAISFQAFAATNPGNFDLIITNPPYFINSLKAPHAARSMARHNDGLPFSVLATLSAQLLREKGILSLILPLNEAGLFHEAARKSGLHLIRQLSIVPVTNKPPNRLLMEFSKWPAENVATESLTIRNENSTYSNAYKEMTKDFYLEF